MLAEYYINMYHDDKSDYFEPNHFKFQCEIVEYLNLLKDKEKHKI
jgi:hypothetical protein